MYMYMIGRLQVQITFVMPHPALKTFLIATKADQTCCWTQRGGAHSLQISLAKSYGPLTLRTQVERGLSQLEDAARCELKGAEASICCEEP